MLHHCPVRRAAATHTVGSPLSTRIHRASRSISYLRRAPPSLYVTCDSANNGTSGNGTPRRRPRRHCAHILDTYLPATDAASPSTPSTLPLTSAVCALRSTSLEDVGLSDVSESSTLLMDVPNFMSADAWVAFLDLHEVELAGLHTLAVTELQPYTSRAVRHLLAVRPSVRVCCSPFMAAVLTDATFFAAVKRAVLERAAGSPAAVHDLHDVLQFAALRAEQVRVVAHGEKIVVDTKAASAADAGGVSPDARCLTALHVASAPTHSGSGSGPTRRAAAAPASFLYTPLYYHDPVLATLHVGSTLARLPWLPDVVSEVTREVLWPRPPLLARRGVRAGQRAAESRDGPLLRPWQILKEASAMTATLRSVPTATHVISSQYGALEGDVEDICAGLTKTADSLEQLRSRLAHHLATDTLRDAAAWTDPLLDKVVKEVLCTQHAHPATEPDVLALVLAWAKQPQTSLHDLASALAYAAVVLPPSSAAPSTLSSTASTTRPAHDEANAKAPRADGDVHPEPPAHRVRSKTHTRRSAPPASAQAEERGTAVSDAASSSDFDGAKGISLLQAIFTKKGLHGLGKAASRAEVDVKVFLTMTPADFRRVFKATPGISRKLEHLQAEIRQNLPE